MSPEPRLAVVLPTQNNELYIGSLVLLCRQYAAQVIVVDDASEDRTAEVALHAGATVFRADEFGVTGRAASIITGCWKAVELGATAVVLIESDGRHLTREIPRLAEPVLSDKADLVIGSRYLAGRRGIPQYQPDTTGSSCPVPEKPAAVTDPGSTFRALGREAIVLLDKLQETEEFESAMVSEFRKRGLSILEIPTTHRYEQPVKNGEDLPLYRGHTVAVVVPAYNEELLIGDAISKVPDFVARIYVVNDCSKDRTQEIIEYYAAHDPAVIPLRHEVNRGVGAAIVTGYKRALADGMDVVAVMAGDDQMDPAFLPDLLDPVIDRKCDYTMGNRLINPEYRKGMSKWRYIGNATLTLITKIASGYWQMMDPQNGYTAISKRALERISLDGIYPRYGYCNDLLVKLNVVGFRVINVPHPARYGMETSKIKYSTYIVRVSRLLLTDFLWRLKMKYMVLNFHPLVFFYFGGAFFTFIGIFGGLYSLHYKFIQGNPIFVPLIMSVIVFSLGVQALFFAMFFDMQQEKATNGWYA